jgi:hypothetical protein
LRKGALAVGLLASGFVPLLLRALFGYERSSAPTSVPTTTREKAYRGGED